jgi:hypothetical protein
MSSASVPHAPHLFPTLSGRRAVAGWTEERSTRCTAARTTLGVAVSPGLMQVCLMRVECSLGRPRAQVWLTFGRVPTPRDERRG